MKVLMITADRQLLREGSDASRRLQLQRSAVERLDVVYWGHGALMEVFRARGSYDVVTVQDPLWRGLVGLIVARKLGTKLNIQVHMDLAALSTTRRFLAGVVLRRADSVRVVSRKLKDQVAALAPQAPVSVLPVFVDLERFRTVVRQPHVGYTVLWVGRFEAEKDPLRAIDVFREVYAALPEARFIMLGQGSLEGDLRSRASGLPVEFPGWQDPAVYLSAADAVLSTSLHEAWGASIVESLAAGVAVVAPDVGIASEAGAVVVLREELSHALIRILKSGARGRLTIELLPAAGWAVQWRSSLI